MSGYKCYICGNPVDRFSDDCKNHKAKGKSQQDRIIDFIDSCKRKPDGTLFKSQKVYISDTIKSLIAKAQERQKVAKPYCHACLTELVCPICSPLKEQDK